MPEEVDTSNGRHWSEETVPVSQQPAAPAEQERGTTELPGPPPTTLTATNSGSWPPAPQRANTPPAEPDRGQQPESAVKPESPAPTTGPRPTQPPPPRQQPWGHPAASPNKNQAANSGPLPAQQVAQRASGTDAEWGAAQQAQPLWGAPNSGQALGQPRPAGPAAAPRRSAEHFAPPETSSEVTQHIRVDPRPRQPGPSRQPAVGRGPDPAEQYRRPGAPMQAASAGIRQELVAIANEERSPVANTGFRGALNKTGLKLKPSKKEQRRREVYRRIRAPKDNVYAIAVLTLKGGAGKTTITATLGQVFSSIRPDGVIAVDADPDAGDLALRTAVHPNNLSMIEMLDQEDLGQHDLVARFLSTTETDLQVLSNGWRPDSDRVLVPEDIVDTREILSHYYSMLLWDGDKALNSAVVKSVLDNSNALVLLVEASRPGAMKAGQAIDWLRNHGYEGLLARTVLVVNETTENTRLDMDALMTVLARQQLKIHHIPFDNHLDEGLFIDLEKLKKKTRRAFEDLAAMLADDFSVPQPPQHAAAAAAAS